MEPSVSRIVDVSNKLAGEHHGVGQREAQLARGIRVRRHAGGDGPCDYGALLAQIRAGDPPQLAQATPPLQSTPGAETKPAAPADPVTTGTRPSDVPPEPARPDADAQKAGAQPALPPAPAEKIAPPIPDRQSPTKER